jgi:hypothetical protein
LKREKWAVAREVFRTPSVPHDFGAHRSDAPYHFVGIRVIRV